MITTSEILPSSELAPFVRCYSYLEFDTNGKNMEKPWRAAHEMTMVFFFKAKPIKLIDWQTEQIVKTGTYCDVTGLATRYLGMATFNGVYSFFEICFKPNGFNKIFGLPPNSFTNHIIAAEDIFNKTISYLFEQLCTAKNLSERGLLTDTFLLGWLRKQKSSNHTDAISFIIDLVLKRTEPTNVVQLANYANMGLRNFERHFLEEVGMPPKLFCSVTRFNHAFEIKLKYPQKDWTSIAHECGYFDQMHLVKDFKRFSGNSPVSFIKQTPLAEREYISPLGT
ncbi:AraC-like DNA-binding protein [Gelidibacter algens]|uniref:AraC-like DNA-binding protein n=1 Tax=Gelidibacter algens TaxID=49280 RepID=A0A1A7R2Y2_9FLAO|nr:AraC family transcriptional regulator [Gelidibacter algens]OBX26620.1 hypothetical protein A9996_03395 [Gelidibacter algens]RAJ25673.1 AraC-like DNA-binding protein [Gelidibacter algens]